MSQSLQHQEQKYTVILISHSILPSLRSFNYNSRTVVNNFVFFISSTIYTNRKPIRSIKAAPGKSNPLLLLLFSDGLGLYDSNKVWNLPLCLFSYQALLIYVSPSPTLSYTLLHAHSHILTYSHTHFHLTLSLSSVLSFHLYSSNAINLQSSMLIGRPPIHQFYYWVTGVYM